MVFMAKFTDVANIWNNVREVDLRPIRESAEQPLRIALLGAESSGRQALADRMRMDPAHPQIITSTPLLIGGLDIEQASADADLFILMVDAGAEDNPPRQDLARSLANSGKRLLIFVNQVDSANAFQAPEKWPVGKNVRMVTASIEDPASLSLRFVPAVMDLLSGRLLALARQFPLFRVPIARRLIDETCFSNAAYSLSTGLAEVVPIFDVPLNLADIIVLTKAQSFLIYKLGLAFGFSTHWQDYVAEFGSIIGGGFMWRQLARFLVGLIPVWGIIPKVGVAYSGTYVVGHAVLQWYLTGRHLTRQQMRELSAHAFARGKILAQGLLARAPHPRLPRLARRKSAALPSPSQGQSCSNCGRENAPDALFCQYCGRSLVISAN
jgi:uncharacterized protein (DUF697 family)